MSALSYLINRAQLPLGDVDMAASRAVEDMYNALKVITLDPDISRALDPKAREQAESAVKAYEAITTEGAPSLYDHCEDDGSGYCILHDSRIVSYGAKPPYDVCENRADVLVGRNASMTLGDVYVGPLDS